MKVDRAPLLGIYRDAIERAPKLQGGLLQPVDKASAIELLVALSDPNRLSRMLSDRRNSADTALGIALQLRDIAKHLAAGWTKGSLRRARERSIVTRAAAAALRRKPGTKLSAILNGLTDRACKELGEGYAPETVRDWIVAEIKARRSREKMFFDSLPPPREQEK